MSATDTINKSESITQCLADLHRCIAVLRSIQGEIIDDKCSDDYELWLIETSKNMITECRGRLRDWDKYYGG